jgi:hypothetical protein
VAWHQAKLPRGPSRSANSIGSAPIKLDLRLIATRNRDLEPR